MAALEGLGTVKFDTWVPVGIDRIAANVAHALSLALPEADRAPIKTLNVIANGPSASLFDVESDGDTLALNGSLALFTALGKAPTYWAGCDAQDFLADFLKVAPLETRYFVASRCDPAVFRALQGRDVELWHVAEDGVETPSRRVPRSCTITLCALTLMRRLGYRHFEIYGWDGSYDGLIHHASDAPLEEHPDDTIHMKFAKQGEDGELTEGREFLTTRRWAVEAQEAVVQLQFADYTYTIHGPGMIGETIRAHVNREAVDRVVP